MAERCNHIIGTEATGRFWDRVIRSSDLQNYRADYTREDYAREATESAQRARRTVPQITWFKFCPHCGTQIDHAAARVVTLLNAQEFRRAA